MPDLTDRQLRALVLKCLYDRRKTGRHDPNPSAALPSGFDGEYFRICGQLLKVGLIDGKIFNEPLQEGGYGPVGGYVEINAFGVDVVEGLGDGSPIPMDFKPITQNIHISNSTGFQVGNNNSQSIVTALQLLVENIERSEVSAEQKAEAKGLLAKSIEHPATVAVIGAAASGVAAVLNR